MIQIVHSMSSYPGRFSRVVGLIFGELGHDFGVEVLHEYFDGLVGLFVGQESAQRVEGVEIPAVPVEGSHAVGGTVAARKHLVQQRHLVFETAVLHQLQLGTSEVLPKY